MLHCNMAHCFGYCDQFFSLFPLYFPISPFYVTNTSPIFMATLLTNRVVKLPRHLCAHLPAWASSLSAIENATIPRKPRLSTTARGSLGERVHSTPCASLLPERRAEQRNCEPAVYRHTFYSVCTMHDACAFTRTQARHTHRHSMHAHAHTHTHSLTLAITLIVRANAALAGCAASPQAPNLTYPYSVAVSLQSAISYLPPLPSQSRPTVARTDSKRAAATTESKYVKLRETRDAHRRRSSLSGCWPAGRCT